MRRELQAEQSQTRRLRKRLAGDRGKAQVDCCRRVLFLFEVIR